MNAALLVVLFALGASAHPHHAGHRSHSLRAHLRPPRNIGNQVEETIDAQLRHKLSIIGKELQSISRIVVGKELPINFEDLSEKEINEALVAEGETAALPESELNAPVDEAADTAEAAVAAAAQTARQQGGSTKPQNTRRPTEAQGGNVPVTTTRPPQRQGQSQTQTVATAVPGTATQRPRQRNSVQPQATQPTTEAASTGASRRTRTPSTTTTEEPTTVTVPTTLRPGQRRSRPPTDATTTTTVAPTRYTTLPTTTPQSSGNGRQGSQGSAALPTTAPTQTVSVQLTERQVRQICQQSGTQNRGLAGSTNSRQAQENTAVLQQFQQLTEAFSSLSSLISAREIKKQGGTATANDIVGSKVAPGQPESAVTVAPGGSSPTTEDNPLSPLVKAAIGVQSHIGDAMRNLLPAH